jgi:hypothetical protein
MPEMVIIIMIAGTVTSASLLTLIILKISSCPPETEYYRSFSAPKSFGASEGFASIL